MCLPHSRSHRSTAASREKVLSAMSRFYPKMSEYGLSSDDDLIEEQQEEAGLGRLPNIDRHLNQSHNRMVGGPNSSHRKSYKRRSGHGSKVANAYSYNTGNSVASSVSLADFDRDYFDDDDDEDDNDGDNDRVRGSGVGGRTGSRKDAQGLVKSVVRWLLTASKWKIALMGLVLGLACAVVHQSYSWLMVDNSTGEGHISLEDNRLCMHLCAVIKYLHTCTVND